jgi:murein DD-endopeptidase MepM/ murein hydrolase activator NlpD
VFVCLSHDYIQYKNHLHQTHVDSEVRSGDVIAYMGDSGSINGSKLHFEVWGKGQKLDPEKWLMKK